LTLGDEQFGLVSGEVYRARLPEEGDCRFRYPFESLTQKAVGAGHRLEKIGCQAMFAKYPDAACELRRITSLPPEWFDCPEFYSAGTSKAELHRLKDESTIVTYRE
jgi:hypothetical protein